RRSNTRFLCGSRGRRPAPLPAACSRCSFAGASAPPDGMTLARAVAALLLGAALLPACSSAPRTISVDMRYSRYSPVALNVRAHETVRFKLVNEDPITHEFILGTAAQQQAHETAPQVDHNGLPGQASLGPGETRTISFTFAAPGSLIFACHRPGHYAYGMRGTITIA